MKVLVYSTHIVNFNPHLETELEVIQNHIDKGDEVIRMVCRGELTACDLNMDHDFKKCLECVNYSQSSRTILSKKIKEIPLLNTKIKTPKFDTDCYDSIEDLKNIVYENFELGYSVSSSLISMLRDNEIKIKTIKPIVDEYLSSTLKIYLSCKETLKEQKPDVVYLFNGRLAHTRAIRMACIECNVNFKIHERGSDMSNYRLVSNDFHLTSSYIYNTVMKYWDESNLSDDEKNKIGYDYFKNRKNGVQKEWISYVKGQNTDLLPIDFDPTKRNIAIFNSSNDEFSSLGKEFEFKFFKNQEEFIENITRLFLSKPEFHFYLRVHPNLKNLNNSQAKRINELKQNNLTVIHPDSKIGSYNLLLNCEKVVTFNSTMGIEATIWDKPSISVAPNLYELLNGQYTVDNYESLVNLLQENLNYKSKENIIKYGYYSAVLGIKFKYYEPETLFTGKFRGKNVSTLNTYLYKLILRLWSIRIIGKPIDLFAKNFKSKRLKLPF